MAIVDSNGFTLPNHQHSAPGDGGALDGDATQVGSKSLKNFASLLAKIFG